VLDPDDPVTLRRLSDLRRSYPADTTLRNLLGALSTKLEVCARLPVLAYEAEQDGHEQAAAAFRELANDERRGLDVLLSSLRLHLDGMAHEMPSKEAR
jgi:hypothetical protein